MAKKWIGVLLVASCLGEATVASAQYLPCPAPPPPAEPLPTSVLGPLPATMAPPGPNDCLSLPANKANAWTGRREPGTNAWESSALAALDAPCPEDECPTSHGFAFGAGLYAFENPSFSHNPAFVVVTDGHTTPIDFTYNNPTVHPLLWASWTNDNGFGVRLRWWHYREQSANILANQVTSDGSMLPINAVAHTQILTPLLPKGFNFQVPDTTTSLDALEPPAPPGDVALVPGVSASPFANGTGIETFKAGSSMRMDVWDFEATQNAQLGKTIVLASAGLRYAYVAQTYYASRFASGTFNIPVTDLTEVGDAFGTVSVDTDANSVISGQTFRGLGPTISLELHRPVGEWGFGLFAIGRGSGYYSKQEQHLYYFRQYTATRTLVDISDATSFTQPISFFDHRAIDIGRHRLAGSGEVEGGVEWGTPGSRWFLQTSLVYQYWSGVGNASSLDGSISLLGIRAVIALQF
jgi:hypothetical protein